MKRIVNPSKSEVFIVVSGQKYVCEAGGEVVVPDNVADRWRNTHEFLIVSGADVVVEPEAPKEEEEEAESEDEEAEEEEEENELEALTVPELKDLLDAKEIEYGSSDRKADLIAKLEE